MILEIEMTYILSGIVSQRITGQVKYAFLMQTISDQTLSTDEVERKEFCWQSFKQVHLLVD